jgi:hypothetical protein
LSSIVIGLAAAAAFAAAREQIERRRTEDFLRR